ncbi:MAG: serine/threonine-protein kinase [Anaerolineae bacterium]|nr:serine/threonine-protein kinase [Anaerolineae bacterium]
MLQKRYQVRRSLAKGGMGAVYQAEDTQLFNRRCVVKEMSTSHLSPDDRAEAERNFRREAALLASLRHSGIPQIYEYFIEGDRYCLVMEYVEGDNLADLMDRSGPLPEAEVLRYALQIGDVLVYLSTRQPPVVHRDVKPANIILRGDPPQAILVDFGVAKPKTGRGPDTAAWGTLGYVAPEQAAGHAEPRSDVYGLAATVYHLLTGDNPGDHPFTFPDLGKLSSRLREMLTRALSGIVDQRPDASEMKAALAGLVAPETLSALRLLEAHTCGGFDRTTERPKGPAVDRFRTRDSALSVCLRLANRDPTRPHEHRMLIQFYSPDGQLYRVRQRPKPILVAAGQAEVHVGVFGLYISGTKVVDHLGTWRALLYLDEQRLSELNFEIVR